MADSCSQHPYPKTDWVYDWGERFPTEILDKILEALAPGSKELINIDHKSSLSVESFGSEQPAPVGVDYDALKTWRWVNKKFARLGAELMFARVSIRLSLEGFERLREMVENPHICALVKKFSYMTYGFSSLGRRQFEALLKEASTKTRSLELEIRRKENAGNKTERPSVDTLRSLFSQSKDDEECIRVMMYRTKDQRTILEKGIDESGLLAGLTAFTGLQQIRLMPLNDKTDDGWSRFCRSRSLIAESKISRWNRGYERASMTLGAAFLSSGSPATRISGRRLPPLIFHRIPGDEVVGRLHCLELNFDDRISLAEEIEQLSGTFHKGFSAAVNMKGLHIGFTRPASIVFNSVFHDVYWRQLLYLGLVAWRVKSDDIIQFFRRHRNSLTSIRLRGVLLEEGSHWVDILKVLRRDLVHLKWVSLRCVGYSSQLHHAGLLIEDEDDDNESSDGSDLGLSQSDGSEDYSDPDTPITDPGHATHSDIDSDDEGSGQGSDAGDSEFGVGINNLAIPDSQMVQHTLPSTSQTHSCYCNHGYSWDDLQDDKGITPSRRMWKWWETWVVKRCPRHDPIDW